MDFVQLKHLQKWLKRECNLSYSLKELLNLKELNLSKKNLKSLHTNINLLTNLQELYCYDNQFTKLELNCPNIKSLYCHNNQLTKLELNCPNLQVLDCSLNQLTKLELNCPILIKLNCSFNHFLIRKGSVSHKLFNKFKFEDFHIIEESNLTEFL